MIATKVGYTQGAKQGPTYEEVCSGSTGHTECVQVMYDPKEVTYERLCDLFWERLGDNRFLKNQVGNDRGTQVSLSLSLSLSLSQVPVCSSPPCVLCVQVCKCVMLLLRACVYVSVHVCVSASLCACQCGSRSALEHSSREHSTREHSAREHSALEHSTLEP